MKIRRNIFLKNKVHYKIGGRARYFFEAKTRRDILNAVNWAVENNIKFVFLGSGTNVLFPDRGYDGLVIKNSYKKVFLKGDEIYASSGVLMSDLVEYFSKKDFGGLEWAGGLPGTFGGAICGNAGAFGGEMKNSIVLVESLMSGAGGIKLLKRSRRGCRFGYRNSIFKMKDDEIILGAYLKKWKCERGSSAKQVKDHIYYRKKHQPIEYPCAGSTFKNISAKTAHRKVLKEFEGSIKNDPFDVIPVAAVLDRLGLKGVGIGGAQISEKHPNFIINRKKATARDVLALIQLAKSRAKKKYGIILEEEIRIIN